MKITYEVKCDYCGAPYTVKMHKAEFKRCTGRSVCGRPACRAENDEDNARRMEEIMADEFVPLSKPASEVEGVGKLPAFGIRRVIWGS